ncbi:MAG: hypothetical protein PHY15_04850 [Eubacteriales bacterium]|nr:hypothetical protein [Eubacteriales bacterium]MDD4475394.1 hypothetical protein [Eubacteriales bacterium]
MKKRIILYVTCIVILLSMGLGGALLYFEKPTIKSGTLNVNGADITSINVTIRKEKFSNPVVPFPDSFIAKINDLFNEGYYYHADLPLTEVLESLGMSVEWVDDNTANIAYEDKKYTLDLTNVSIVEVGTTQNHISPLAGGRRVYTVLDRELILDDTTIKWFVHEVGKEIDVRIVFDELVVYLTERVN